MKGNGRKSVEAAPESKIDLQAEQEAMNQIIAVLEAQEPVRARRIFQYVISHQEERFARLMAAAQQRQRMANETVAQ